VALRAPRLRAVEEADHSEVLRLLAKRNIDIGNQRTRVVCRLHSLFAELAPGGMAKEMYVSDADVLMAKVAPETPAQQIRYDLALELLDDVRRLDAQLKESHRRIRVAVRASDASVTDIYGVGPIIAAQVIGYSGDIRRFANRDAYASYNGTAPVERSSGGRVVHRVSLRGNRKLNHAIHMAAISQIRQTGSDGRVYFDRKVAEGKTKKESIRSLKRHISNAVYRQLVLDAR
jgi:transposase